MQCTESQVSCFSVTDMSPIGHSLVGASLAVLAMPRAASPLAWAAGVSAAVVLANLPDAPLPYWGHDAYYISHSLFVTLGAIVLLGAGWFIVRGRHGPNGTRLLIVGALAWLSHLLLDSFYNHGQGIAILWPFSERSLNLAIPWFHILDVRCPWYHARNLNVMGIELLAYSPLLACAIAARVLTRRR